LAILSAQRWQRLRERRKRQRRIALRVTSRYAEDALREAASQCDLAIDSRAACQWGDFARLNWDELLSGKEAGSRTSCLYLRAGLVRKAMLAHYLGKRKINDVLPEGIVMDVEDEEDLEALRRRLAAWLDSSSGGCLSDCPGEPVWIAKASVANRGEHLYLAHSVDDVIQAVRPAALETGLVEWVIQRYIARPLLLHGRKFHIRSHLLVSGCPRSGVTRAWLHRDAHIALVASVSYGEDRDSRYAHLTNHCVQEVHPQYNEDGQILTLEEVGTILGRPTLAKHTHAAMEQALARALEAANSAPAGFAPLPQCFELFGADFILEDRGADCDPGVWLLEVNAGPDFAIFGSRLRPRCITLLKDILRIAVEPYLHDEVSGTAQFLTRPERLAGTGFGDCIWSVGPRTASLAEELNRFKRRVSIASRWAQSLHEESGVRVRGPQAAVCGSGPDSTS